MIHEYVHLIKWHERWTFKISVDYALFLYFSCKTSQVTGRILTIYIYGEEFIMCIQNVAFIHTNSLLVIHMIIITIISKRRNIFIAFIYYADFVNHLNWNLNAKNVAQTMSYLNESMHFRSSKLWSAIEFSRVFEGRVKITSHSMLLSHWQVRSERKTYQLKQDS